MTWKPISIFLMGLTLGMPQATTVTQMFNTTPPHIRLRVVHGDAVPAAPSGHPTSLHMSDVGLTRAASIAYPRPLALAVSGV